MGGRLAGLGCVAILAMGLGVAACGQGMAGDPAPESTKTTQQKELVVGPTSLAQSPYPVDDYYTSTPWQFPNGDDPFYCSWSSNGLQRGQYPAVVAYPTCATEDDNRVTDPYATKYTHGYMWDECQTNDIRCAHASALFNISTANGYIYRVNPVGDCHDPNVLFRFADGTCALNQYLYLQGLARVDSSWSSYPPAGAGAGTSPENTPWLDLSPNGHPSDGTNYESGDWLNLWNVVYSYSSTGPYESEGAAVVDAKLVTCVPVYAYVMAPGGTCQNPIYLPDVHPIIDYFVAADQYDPMGHDW